MDLFVFLRILDAVFLKALFALLTPDLSMIWSTFSSAIYEFIHFIEEKEIFFFGLAEGPFKAMQRVLFDVKRKLDRISKLEIENNELKKRIAQLEKELKSGK